MNIFQLSIIFIIIYQINVSDSSFRIARTINDTQFSSFSHENITEAHILKRDKRFILFSGGGISKSVLGILVPIETKDKVNWRTMNLGYNFQAQYTPIPTVFYPWQLFERSMVERKREFDDNGTYFKDDTRTFVYAAIELIMNRMGKNGKQCLLRAICEAAQSPIKRIGIFDEIVHLILTPNVDEVHDEYIDAKLAGDYGVDCLDTHKECPYGDSILDRISMFL